MFYLKTFRWTLVRNLVRNPCAEALCGIWAPLCGTCVLLTFPRGGFPRGTIPQGGVSQGNDSPGESFPWGMIPQGGVSLGNDSPGGRFPRGSLPGGRFPWETIPQGGFSQGNDSLGDDSPGEKTPRGSVVKDAALGSQRSWVRIPPPPWGANPTEGAKNVAEPILAPE